MRSSYNEIHKNILSSAKKNFLEKGFDKSNLREICKGANVTTGAFYRHFKDKEAIFDELVEPALNKMKACYVDLEDEFYKSLDNRDNDKILDMTGTSILSFIELIYEHYDEFKLLLASANGTKHENFIDDIAEVETVSTMKFIEKLKEYGYKITNISQKEVQILIQAYFSAIFKIVIRYRDKIEAIKYAKTVIDFNKIGWKSILGI